MTILFIIKVKILMFIEWSFSPLPLPIILTIGSKRVTIIWACNPISCEDMSLLVSILGATPNHIPLKWKCPNKKNNWIHVVYLTLNEYKWYCKHFHHYRHIFLSITMFFGGRSCLIMELLIKYSWWNHGFSPKSWIYENSHNVTQVFSMFKLSYTTSGVMLSNTGFLACPTRLGGPT